MISESKIIVRYQETDQMGIAHHSVYPVWFEVARTDFIKKLGITYSEIEIGRASCRERVYVLV